MISKAIIDTEQGSNYIGKLCRHFRHKIETSYSENSGKAIFPKGVCEMNATPQQLVFEIDAPDLETVEKIQGVIDRHLIKFAFRESLTITWVNNP